MNSADPEEARAGTAHEALDFTPVVNGVDFLDNAITNLRSSHYPRSLKYAVLHLQAAIEILVKVRLQREGFEHVFVDPCDANENKLQQGKFRSVTLDEAHKRLKMVAEIQLKNRDIKKLKKLGDERNKLQHFGSTSDHEIVATIAAHALEVLSQFISDHLVPGAANHEIGPLKRAEGLIRDALPQIRTATQARLERVEPELARWDGIVIHCPDCLQVTWTFEPGDESSQCRFCTRRWWQEPSWEAAEEYVTNVLNESAHLAAQGKSGWSISMCPNCEESALVAVATRNDPDSFPTKACFHCGFTAAEQPLGYCLKCGRTTHDPDVTLCRRCLERD